MSMSNKIWILIVNWNGYFFTFVLTQSVPCPNGQEHVSKFYHQSYWYCWLILLPRCCRGTAVVECAQLNTQIAKFMGPTWGPPGACRPRWAPCWPHEPCYQGSIRFSRNGIIEQNCEMISSIKFSEYFIERCPSECVIIDCHVPDISVSNDDVIKWKHFPR